MVVSRGPLLCYLLIARVFSDCVPATCLQCNSTEFWVNISSSVLNPNEGDDVTLVCDNNLPNKSLTFGWTKDGKVQNTNQSELVLHKVLSYDSGLYNCSVNSLCGSYSAQYSLTVTSNSMILLVICAVAALSLILIMGLAMKFKLKRDRAKHRQRRKQREETGQSGGPTPITPRHS